MIDIDEIICYTHISQEEGHIMLWWEGTHGVAPGLIRKQRERKELWSRYFIVVSMGGDR